VAPIMPVMAVTPRTCFRKRKRAAQAMNTPLRNLPPLLSLGDRGGAVVGCFLAANGLGGAGLIGDDARAGEGAPVQLAARETELHRGQPAVEVFQALEGAGHEVNGRRGGLGRPAG
jgi:hypothetical protein